ncbi:MAG TPA: hypothetical protein VIY08_15895, partial [Candidatus Nitrosocosmicus sp.]
MLQYSFEKSSSVGLGCEEMRNPLFCWMIGSLNPYGERLLRQSINVATITNSNKSSPHLILALLYQIFIHSLVRAKYKDGAKDFSKDYVDEMNLLRKIAVIKQSCESTKEVLTINKMVKYLRDYHGLDYSKDLLVRKDIFDQALTSYFYLSGQKTKDKTPDFIHENFKDHLLAEYYIGTMLESSDNRHNNVAIPSDNTINHLEGLLKMIEDENEILKKQTDVFISSLKVSQKDNKTLKEILVENAIKIVKYGDLNTSEL